MFGMKRKRIVELESEVKCLRRLAATCAESWERRLSDAEKRHRERQRELEDAVRGLLPLVDGFEGLVKAAAVLDGGGELLHLAACEALEWTREDLERAYPYEACHGVFDAMSGRVLVRYMEKAEFGKVVAMRTVDWQQQKIYELDERSDAFVEYRSDLESRYRRKLKGYEWMIEDGEEAVGNA